MSFLDFGCGYGRIGIPVIKYLNKKLYTGIDLSEERIRLAKKYVKKEKLEHKAPILLCSLDKSLKEAYRVLKPGGRFLCLEFSKISNSNLKFLYKNYSKLIPRIGKLVVGESEPYEYLVESIDKFINQNQLIELMKKNGFENCKYRDLSGGIVSIHSGWKI